MKLNQKITLGTLGVIVGLLAGTLTIVEKSINIVSALKPKASVQTEKSIDMGIAGRIDKETTKTTARGVQ